jgi:TRAP-type C4-dicarboxylate transport system permease small subunit
MKPEDYRRELERQLQREAARDRRRLALRLTGWCLMLACLAVIAWVGMTA